MKHLTKSELAMRGPLELAYIGDCVYELYFREREVSASPAKVGAHHTAVVAFVSAPAQARAVAALLPTLSEPERAAFNRGRNVSHKSIPHGASDEEYRAATGLECLIGWLWLGGERERALELCAESERIISAQSL